MHSEVQYLGDTVSGRMEIFQIEETTSTNSQRWKELEWLVCDDERDSKGVREQTRQADRY